MSSRVRGLPVFGFAVAGLLLGHLVSYLVAIPDPHHRDLVLRQTGHGYLPAAGEVAVILTLAAAAALVARSWSGRGRDTIGFASLAACLTVIQVVAFAGQEVLERLVAGAPLGGLLHEHLLLAGLIAQVAVALTGAAVLRWLEHAATRLAGVMAFRPAVPRPVAALALPLDPDLVRDRTARATRSVRAPPSS